MIEKFIEPGFIKSILIISVVLYALIAVAPHFYPSTSSDSHVVRDPESEKKIIDLTFQLGKNQAVLEQKDKEIEELHKNNVSVINTGKKKKEEYKNLSTNEQVSVWNKQFNEIFNK